MKSCRPKHFSGSLSHCEVSVQVKGGSLMNEDTSRHEQLELSMTMAVDPSQKVREKSRKSAVKRSRLQRCLGHFD